MKKNNDGLHSRALRRVLRAALFALSLPGRLLSLPVKLYRRYISPLKGAPSCRFSPTCSEYAVGSLREWGVVIGGALTVWRILRCNPFSKGGDDPVPENPIRRRLLWYVYGEEAPAGGPSIPQERK